MELTETSLDTGLAVTDTSLAIADTGLAATAVVDPSEQKCCDSNSTCLAWTLKMVEGCCECNTAAVSQVTRCEELVPDCRVLLVKNCYCLWFEDNGRAILAPCLHTCYLYIQAFYYRVPYVENHTKFNQMMCNSEIHGVELHRKASSRLCGKCDHGYGLAVYSYQFSKCIPCQTKDYHVPAYLVVAFLPLTLFYLLVIVLRIRATSGDMNSFVFFSQVVTTPLHMRLFVNAIQARHYRNNVTYLKVIYSFYGIWNLDFFRLLYRPFCINKHMSAQGVISLDYIVAVYPLVLVVGTYVLVHLHGRGCKVVVFLWKPFQKCCMHLRSQWDCKASLVQAFSTFLLLSYIKILGVSFDLLLPSFAFKLPSLEKSTYFYYDASTKLFEGTHHLVFYIFALVAFVLSIFPVVLMLAYPCTCFHKLFNISHPGFYIFMDSFTGCYRQSPSYCRAFPGVYFFLRLLLLAIFEVTSSLIYIPSISAVVMLAAILFAIARPYKRASHNVMDVVFLVHLAICFNVQNEALLVKNHEKGYSSFVTLYVVVLALPLLYPLFLILRSVCRSSLMWRIRGSLRTSTDQQLVSSVSASGGHYESLQA